LVRADPQSVVESTAGPFDLSVCGWHDVLAWPVAGGTRSERRPGDRVAGRERSRLARRRGPGPHPQDCAPEMACLRWEFAPGCACWSCFRHALWHDMRC